MKPFLALLAMMVGLLLPAGAVAYEAPMMPQDQGDGIVATSGGASTWADLPGGVAARPYISSLSVTDAAGTRTLIEAGTTTYVAPAVGSVTPVVLPSNLCRAGTTPVPGQCYATPNRVGISLGLVGLNNSLNQDLTGGATADSVYDMTVKLNTLGQSLRWSWANLDLLYWRTTGLGTPDAEFQVRFRPVATPYVVDYGSNNGCTATPIRDCNLTQSAATILAASITLSLDETVNTALTGAIFATQGAVFGYLNPTGTATAPVLDLQVASAHLQSDGLTLQTGSMKALLPAQSLLNIYGVLPADAGAFFSTTRTGSAGTNSAPTSTVWSAATEGSDGVLISLTDITFSAPTYKVKRKTAAAKATTKTAGRTTTLTVSPLAACKAKACTATLYAIASTTSGNTKKLGTAVSNAGGGIAIMVAKAKLKKGTRYSVTIRRTKGGKLVTTAAGIVGSSLSWGSSRSGGSNRHR